MTNETLLLKIGELYQFVYNAGYGLFNTFDDAAYHYNKVDYVSSKLYHFRPFVVLSNISHNELFGQSIVEIFLGDRRFFFRMKNGNLCDEYIDLVQTV